MNVFQLIWSDYVKYRNYGSNFFGIVFITSGFLGIYSISHCKYYIQLHKKQILAENNHDSFLFMAEDY